MHEGNFRSAPVVADGRLIGIVTDRDLRMHTGYLDNTEAKLAMSENPVTVTPTTPVHEAARIIFEQKVDSLPVIEDGKLVGVITNSDILRAYLDQD
jgi:acetoin utilization protein AcuB